MRLLSFHYKLIIYQSPVTQYIVRTFQSVQKHEFLFFTFSELVSVFSSLQSLKWDFGQTKVKKFLYLLPMYFYYVLLLLLIIIDICINIIINGSIIMIIILYSFLDTSKKKIISKSKNGWGWGKIKKGLGIKKVYI